MNRQDQRRSELLEPALRAIYGERSRVLGMQLAVGGNSRETWVADIFVDGEASRVVMRCDPDSWIRPQEMHREISGLRTAERAGIPAPRIIISSEELDLGRPYVVTTFVEGTAIARRIIREPEFEVARSRFARECGQILARLHGASEHAVGWECWDPIADLNARYVDTEHPSPVLAGSLRWLETNRPSPLERRCPVHGDFRLGNLMINRNGIAAVLDWETCHQCDPYEDLGWLCSRAWRYGGELPVGGIGTLEDLLKSYEEHSGCAIDLDRLHWWVVYGLTSWGLVCNRKASGNTDRLNRSAGARLVARQEYNVMLELEKYVGR